MEILSLRATTMGKRSSVQVGRKATGIDAGAAPQRAPRPAYVHSARALETVEVFDGDRLAPGHRMTGPAIVEGATTSMFIPESFDALVDRSGNVVMHRKGTEEEI
jgi:N-methylhydantoinase A